MTQICSHGPFQRGDSTLTKKCRKIAGKLPENFYVPFRSVFYPFLEQKNGICRMESGKKNGSVFFPFFFRIAFFKNGFFFASVFCPFFKTISSKSVLFPFFFRFSFKKRNLTDKNRKNTDSVFFPFFFPSFVFKKNRNGRIKTAKLLNPFFFRFFFRLLYLKKNGMDG